MNTNDQDPNIGHEDASNGDDAALITALAELRQDKRPAQDLWAGIEARLGNRITTALPALADEPQRPAALSALRLDAKPGHDLWPGIQGRIRSQRWRRLRTPLTAAAGLAATMVLVLGLQVQRGAVSPTVPAAHAPLRASAEVLAAMQEAPHGDNAYRSVSSRPLAPETRALVRANLKIVASAETQLKRALAADPDAAYLNSLLATAQQQKQDLRYALADRQ